MILSEIGARQTYQYFRTNKHRCRRHPQHLPCVSCTATAAAAVVRPITPKPAVIDPSTGFVTNDASLSKVPPEWNSLLAGVTAAYRQVCGSNLVGVYLRGSLARGYFLPGLSDVDTFALVTPARQLPLVHGAAHPDAGSSSSSRANDGNSTSSPSCEKPAGDETPPASQHQLVQLQLQQQVKDVLRPVGVQYSHLGVTKVEVKVLEVTAGTAAAAVLCQHMAAAAVQPVHASGEQGSSWDGSTAAAHLHSSQSNNACSSSSSNSCATGFSAPVLTPSLLSSIPAAFELKTQSVCLHGVDLPLLLPPAAALLPSSLQLLPGLAEDIAAAKRKAEEAAALGDSPLQVSVVCWCLKRLLRAAFELVQQQAATYTRDLYWCCQISSLHMPQLQQHLEQALQLYVTLQAPLQQQQQRPQQCVVQEDHQHQDHHQHQQQQQIPKQSVGALQCDQQHSTQPQQQQQQHTNQVLFGEAWQLVDTLLPHLETAFLKQMLSEDPGWLTKHVGAPIPASNNASPGSNNRLPSRSRSGISSNHHHHQKRQHWPWANWQQTLQQLKAAAIGASNNTTATRAVAAAASCPTWLLGAAPPPVQLPVWGQVAQYDWGNAQQQASACAAVSTMIMGQQHHGRSSGDAENGVLAAAAAAVAANTSGACNTVLDRQVSELERSLLLNCAHQQPLVLRGLGASWSAVQGDAAWGLSWLACQGFRGKVRVAPSLQFPFVEPQLVQLLIQISGAAAAAPSLEFDMDIQEYVQRLQPNCTLPPLVFTPHEYYYMQASLPLHMEQQLRLTELLQQIQAAAAALQPADEAEDHGLQQVRSSSSSIDAPPSWPRLSFSQAPRLWVSPAGAVSPLHYDTSHSCLLQVRGFKRMLLVSPEQLYRLYCYPETHVLRRRSRVNLTKPNLSKHPLFAGVGALEVTLGPGDALVFPSRWAHHTESLGEAAPAGRPAASAAAAATGTGRTDGVGAAENSSSAGSTSRADAHDAVCGCCVSVTFRMTKV